jgi:hypothetical protein
LVFHAQQEEGELGRGFTREEDYAHRQLSLATR